VPEPESGSLRAELARWDRHASSALALTEAVRAARRVDASAHEVARRVVGALDLLAVGDGILRQAANLEPVELRTLDAIHLASALALGEELGVLVAYDPRLLEAAEALGLTATAPR
jgi:predicted nucleic acid-binding protein